MTTKVYGGATFVIDFTADVEITGTQVLSRRLIASASGDNTLITVVSGLFLKLYKAIISVASDVTGEVILKIGTTEVGSVRNPKAGSQYVLTSTFPDFDYGADGEDLIINLPVAIAVSINTSYEVV